MTPPSTVSLSRLSRALVRKICSLSSLTFFSSPRRRTVYAPWSAPTPAGGRRGRRRLSRSGRSARRSRSGRLRTHRGAHPPTKQPISPGHGTPHAKKRSAAMSCRNSVRRWKGAYWEDPKSGAALKPHFYIRSRKCGQSSAFLRFPQPATPAFDAAFRRLLSRPLSPDPFASLLRCRRSSAAARAHPLKRPCGCPCQPKSLRHQDQAGRARGAALPGRHRPPDGLQQGGDPLAGGGADGVNLDATTDERPGDRRQLLADLGEVYLVDGHDLPARGERRIVERQLPVGGVEVPQRGALRARIGAGIEQVDQDAAFARRGAGIGGRGPAPRVRALDEAGDVGQHEAPPVREPDHAQVRHQRGERVVGDLRTRGRDRAMNVDLPTLGKPSRPTSASSLSSSRARRSSAGVARLGPPGRAIGRGREVDVAAAAVAALRGDEALPVELQVHEQLARSPSSNTVPTGTRRTMSSPPRP